MPEAFDVCGGRTAPGFSARAGLRPVAQLVLSATLDVSAGPGQDCVTSYPPIPPDATGHFEESAWRTHGYPVYQTGLRIAIRPFRFRNDEPELAFQVERAWRQHLWIPVLSLSDLVGHGPIRLLLEASAAWYRIPFIVHSFDLDQGVVIRSTVEERSITSTSYRLRVGLALTP